MRKDFEIPKYLDIPSFRERQMTSKILCSSHKLHIETGRHTNTPREERTCQLCSSNEIESEDHFIVNCEAYANIRNESPIPFNNYSNAEALFDIEDPLILAEFLRNAYSHRDKLTTPQAYRVKPTSSDGLKLLLCKGPNTPGRLKIKNITKDGLRLKIFRTSANTPFTT